MKLLFENWRSYLKEGMKQTKDIGRALIEDDEDRIRIKIYDNGEGELAQSLGQMFCVLLDWDEDDKDQSINCSNDVWVVMVKQPVTLQ